MTEDIPSGVGERPGFISISAQILIHDYMKSSSPRYSRRRVISEIIVPPYKMPGYTDIQGRYLWWQYLNSMDVGSIIEPALHCYSGIITEGAIARRVSSVTTDKSSLMYRSPVNKDKWYTPEEVGWLYAGFVASRILTAGFSDIIWGEDWVTFFSYKYEYKVSSTVTVLEALVTYTSNIKVACTGELEFKELSTNPALPLSESDPSVKVLTEDVVTTHTGYVAKDGAPQSTSWIGRAAGAVEKGIDYWENTTGMPIQTVTIAIGDSPDAGQPEATTQSSPTIEELGTSYEVVADFKDGDDIAILLSAHGKSSEEAPDNLTIADKGTGFTNYGYSAPGFSTTDLDRYITDGTILSSQEFSTQFGIILPPNVEGVIITGYNIDYNHELAPSGRPYVQYYSGEFALSDAYYGTMTVKHVKE